MAKNLIYCFSGTGNSLDIARNIAKVLGDTDIVMMRSAPAVTDCSGAERVGFVFPCYAGGLPGRVEEYVRSLKLDADSYKFAVTCYAGYPGVGAGVIDDIVGLDYWTGISQHSSCIWLMPHDLSFPRMTAEQAQTRAEKLAAEAGAAILRKERSPKKPSRPAFNRVEAMAWPKICAKKAEDLRVTADCIACGQCVRLCPQGNIRMFGGKPTFGTDCIQCLGCLQFCPKQAIHMGGATRKRERFHNLKVAAEDLTQAVIHVD